MTLADKTIHTNCVLHFYNTHKNRLSQNIFDVLNDRRIIPQFG